MSENSGAWPRKHKALDELAAKHDVAFPEKALVDDKIQLLVDAGVPAPESGKTYGLVLVLGGAPNVPHQIPGLDGTFQPDVPTPLEEAGITLEQARAFNEDEGCPLELVEVRR